MTQRGKFQRGLFNRLIEDRAGNTLAIVAASTLPMMAIIGGGVDISRAYMAKTQLQSACDAGVLAGRRAMSKTSEYGDAEQGKANAMFDFNFDADAVQATDVTFESEDNDDGEVVGTATATMPTAIMKIFGKTEINLEVDCMAELQLANVDVMFVLDTTGSMAGSRIEGLRDAVRDFHATLATAVTDAETRVRYGFVPYSSTVNAKELLTATTNPMPKSYFRDSAPYQSRVALFDTLDPNKKEEVATDPAITEYYGGEAKTPISSTNCTNYGKNKYPDSSGSTTITIGTKPDPVTEITYSYGGREGSGTNRPCYRYKTVKNKTYHDVYSFTKWIYKQEEFDTSSYKNFTSVRLVTSLNTSSDGRVRVPGRYHIQTLAALNNVAGSGITGFSTSSSTWNGCIEERDTVQTNDFSPIPDGAYDLDINLEPENTETSWRPLWTAAAWYRDPGVTESDDGNKPSAACPAPMKLFRKIDLSSTTVPDWLEDYLEDDLVATGNTYHDIGMIWGARLGSSRGIFADNVNEGFDDGSVRSVSRHLIFMTDGKMEPERTRYTAYGTEQSDNRIGPVNASNNDLVSLHSLRFRAACDAAKAEGYIIYVVAFAGTTVTNDMKYCSSDNRWYYSSNTESLRNTFKFIASQVADLRLGA